MYVKNLVFLFCYMLLAINLNMAEDYSLQLECYDTGNFSTNSTYGKNLELILSFLPDNASENGGFYNATIGQGSGTVYALALCQGDASPEECSSCVHSRVKEIKAGCPNQKETFLWEAEVPCLVHYADRYIFGTPLLDPISLVRDRHNLTDVSSNLTQFYQTGDTLMEGLMEATSRGTSRLKFATGRADVDSKIYALMQCTPDLSQTDCSECLMVSTGQFNIYSRDKQGGYALTANCLFRWELFPFFNSSAETLYLPSSPPNSTTSSIPNPSSTTSRREENHGIKSRTVVIIVIPTILFVVMLKLAYAFLRNGKNSKLESKNDSLKFKVQSFLPRGRASGSSNPCMEKLERRNGSEFNRSTSGGWCKK